MPEMKVSPSRWYYALAGAVLVAGLVGFVLILFSGISGITGGLTQMVVPGRHELALTEAGKYTVFHEYRSVVGNKVYSMRQGGLPGLECSLSRKATGETVPLSRSAMNSTYTMGSRSGYRSSISASIPPAPMSSRRSIPRASGGRRPSPARGRDRGSRAGCPGPGTGAT